MNFQNNAIDLTVGGTPSRVRCIYSDGHKLPVLLLHGFGSTKEDFADLIFYPQFQDRPVYAYDAPCFGESTCADPSALSIPFLKEVATQLIIKFGFRRFHLVGHSMGGLTALLLAHSLQDRVLSFTSIEGNLAPEDCFLSRQILEYPPDDTDEFLESFIARVSTNGEFSSLLYAINLRHKVNAGAVAPVFRSMVHFSDHENLLTKFLNLQCHKMFVYGESNSSLSYLDKLNEEGVPLCQIAYSGHFPMYANPTALWVSLGDFLNQSEAR